MEEKKKRWRPSLTEYRKLEKDRDSWQEKYLDLKENTLPEYDRIASENRVKDLQGKIAQLEQSNALMEDELNRVRNANRQLSKFNDDYKLQITALKNRSLWKRIINKY